jgi:hypothetical protein
MSFGRAAHNMIALPTGKVLAVGGTDSDLARVEAEEFDPAAGTWKQVGSMTEARTTPQWRCSRMAG